MAARWNADDILQTLDQRCDSYTFPMLDNGYVYLAATRMSLHRSADDWGLTIEVFGFSLRAGLPDTHILQLEEWHHPDVVDDQCRPSGSETFSKSPRSWSPVASTSIGPRALPIRTGDTGPTAEPCS